MNLMKCSLILTFVAAMTCRAEVTEVHVFGDSLSSSDKSWPNVLVQIDADPDTEGHQFFATIKNRAQGGLSWANQDAEQVFSIPDWFYCASNENRAIRRVVILWLGGNDGIFGTDLSAVEHSVRESLQYLTNNNCETLIGLPPQRDMSSPDYQSWENVRAIISQVASEYGITPTEVPYNWAWTTDGLHPNDFQSWLLANFWIREVL